VYIIALSVRVYYDTLGMFIEPFDGGFLGHALLKMYQYAIINEKMT
jgi:hypothetical protein